MNKYKKLVGKLLSTADIKVNGPRDFDIQILNREAYKRIWDDPSVGGGESYMDGWWECARLDKLFYRAMRFLKPKEIYHLSTFVKFIFKHYIINQQSRIRSHAVAKEHYDLGNDLYAAMLGETMAYTCGYWKDAQTLDEAQIAKYDLICKKVNLQKGEKVLELGCGWGGFAKYAVENYGVEITAVNISSEQMKFAKEACKGLPVKLFITDYRDVKTYNPDNIKFDKVISIGMCEHVGHRNSSNFIKIAHDNLKDDGLFLMHTIGKNNTLNFADPWIRKYIFPSGMLPSIKQIAGKSENLFVIEDLHNFGNDYDKTLMAWYDNFEKHWPELKDNYNERFHRMWKYYLLSCAGAFRARSLQLWQFVFSPKGQINGYRSIR